MARSGSLSSQVGPEAVRVEHRASVGSLRPAGGGLEKRRPLLQNLLLSSLVAGVLPLGGQHLVDRRQVVGRDVSPLRSEDRARILSEGGDQGGARRIFLRKLERTREPARRDVGGGGRPGGAGTRRGRSSRSRRSPSSGTGEEERLDRASISGGARGRLRDRLAVGSRGLVVGALPVEPFSARERSLDPASGSLHRRGAVREDLLELRHRGPADPAEHRLLGLRSSTKNMGSASVAYCFRYFAFSAFSTSRESQTNCPAYRPRALSVKT